MYNCNTDDCSLLLAIANGDFSEGLLLSEKTLHTVAQLSEESLPNKQQFIATLHSCIGTTYLEMGDTSKAMEQFIKDKEIAEKEYIMNDRLLYDDIFAFSLGSSLTARDEHITILGRYTLLMENMTEL